MNLINKPRMKILIGAIVLLFSVGSNAELTKQDWKTPGDNLILQDSDTGLEWLKITQTLNMSVNDVMGQWYGNTEIQPLAGNFSEFRYATNTEIEQLYTNFGIKTFDYVRNSENITGAKVAFQALGTSLENTSLQAQYGLGINASNEVIRPRIVWEKLYHGAKALVNTGGLLDTKNKYTGSYLVREIKAPPIPASVKFSEYFFSGNNGNTWTYLKSDFSQFTYTYETINIGVNAGFIKVGNENSGIIFESHGDLITWHEVIGGDALIQPFSLPIDMPLNQDIGLELIALKSHHITVPAGDFNDVIALVWLDRNFPANTMNATLGINAITASAVTKVEWYAKGVGLIKTYGVDAGTGSNDGTLNELFSYGEEILLPSNKSGDIPASDSAGGMLNIYLMIILLLCLISVRAVSLTIVKQRSPL